MAYRKESPPAPEKDRRPVVRMPEPPEALERADKEELARVMRAESRAIALALEEERRRFDRVVRGAGFLAAMAGLGLASLGPLPRRAALLAGAALLGGFCAALVGGQGATGPETIPTWARWALTIAGLVGAALGLAYLG